MPHPALSIKHALVSGPLSLLPACSQPMVVRSALLLCNVLCLAMQAKSDTAAQCRLLRRNDWANICRSGPSKHPGAQSALISLQPGTHHVRFIVDNDMKLSNFMPTAVDFTNFLVNYIEVVSTPEPTTTPSEPVDVPPGTKPLPTAAQPRPIEYRAPPGVHPPHVLPPTPELIAVGATGKSAPKSADATPTSKPTLVAPAPAKRYHREVPRFLLDLDAPDDSPNYARANAVLHTAPAAPTLPIFLNKSILNGTTPVKDDASVLNMPNHTMLNHLATSSIKNKVLATSATTRYKSKVGK